MYLLYICFDDSLVVYTVNLRVQNKLGIPLQLSEEQLLMGLNLFLLHETFTYAYHEKMA